PTILHSLLSQWAPILCLVRWTLPIRFFSGVHTASLKCHYTQDPAFTIFAIPGPCIHYIHSPRTLHSLYSLSRDPAFTIALSMDPAFTISGLPGPSIHYIRSPWTLHSLYPL
ncbi:unnamed protein product, partial [Staurois parvus]